MSVRILISIVINLLVACFVYFGIDFPFLSFLWLISILVLVVQFDRNIQIKKTAKLLLRKVKKNRLELIGVIALCLLLILIVVLNYDSERFHQDDLITAYFSITHNFSGLAFFSPVPNNPTDWVCQFPSSFFVIQQMILGVIGTTNLSVKLSIIPYDLVILIFLYLSLRAIFTKRIAFVGSFFYIFLGISLYFTTLGLHFISSTAIYIVSMYFVVGYIKKPSFNLAVVLGICAAFSMLFYVSSYLVPLFIVGIMLLKIFDTNKKNILCDISVVMLLFLSILLPFIAYCYKENNWYFLQRISQVNLIEGEWSENKTKDSNTSLDATKIYLNNLDLSLKSLYTDGIGGQGGYNTSRLAFFDKVTAIYFLFSVALVIVDYRRSFIVICFLLTIIATFIAGMVMTIPPPPFHRMTLVLPALAIVFSYPLKILKERIKQKYIFYGVVLYLVVVFAMANLIHARKSIETELINPQTTIINYIRDNFPNKNLYMASYPSFAMGKFCAFYNNCYSKNLIIDSSENILLRADEIKNEEAIVYVLFYSQVKDEFEQMFPGYNVVQFESDQVIIFK